MSTNLNRNKILKGKILKYIDSFPDGYISNKKFYSNFSDIDLSELDFNANELQEYGYIKREPLGISITSKGKSFINPKDKFLNQNTFDYYDFLKEAKKIINKSTLPPKEKKEWLESFKKYGSNINLLFDILSKAYKFYETVKF